MVTIRPNRMRSVTETRNAFNVVVAEAEEGLTTHIVKGSTVVAHLVPANAPILDDRNLRDALVHALAIRDAAAVGAHEWRDGQLWHAGDSIGRLLAWTWGVDPHWCLQALAIFHDRLQQVVGGSIDLAALRPGIEMALRVSLDVKEIADLFEYLGRNYGDYYLGPLNSTVPANTADINASQ